MRDSLDRYMLVLAVLAGTVLAVLLADTCIAEPVRWRTPNGREGFSDRAAVPAGAEILGAPSGGTITRTGPPAQESDTYHQPHQAWDPFKGCRLMPGGYWKGPYETARYIINGRLVMRTTHCGSVVGDTDLGPAQ